MQEPVPARSGRQQPGEAPPAEAQPSLEWKARRPRRVFTHFGFCCKGWVCRACSKTNRDGRSLLVFLRGQTTISRAFLRFVIFKTTTVNTMPDNTHPQPTLNIELPEDVAEGIYSNLAIISHSNAEFVVDFIRLMPNVPKARVKSRIILTPQHAKRLLYALKDNIHKYEMQFGKIEEPEHPQLPPMNFNTPPAQA